MEVERGPLATLTLLFVVLLGVPAVQGEHVFFTPPLGWLGLVILTALWWGLGRPGVALERGEARTLGLLIGYLVLHTLFLGQDRYLWVTTATHALGLGLGVVLLAACLGDLYHRNRCPPARAVFGLVLLFHVGLLGLRLTGFMPYRQPIDWSFFTTLILVLSLGLLQAAPTRFRWGAIAAVGVSLWALFLHQNRTALLCTVLFLVYETLWGPLRRIPRRLLWWFGAAWVAIGMVLMWLWTTRDPYGTLRLQMWTRELRFILDHPWGAGLGQLPVWMPALSPAQPHGAVRYDRILTHPHQQYLGWIMELGWPVVVFLVLFGYGLIRILRRQLQGMARALLIRAWVMVGVWGFFHDLTASAVLLFLVGALAVWTLAERNRMRPAVKPWRWPGALVVTVLVAAVVPMMVSRVLVGWGQNRLFQKHATRARSYFVRALQWWQGNAWARFRLVQARAVEAEAARGPADVVRWYPVLADLFQAVVDHPGAARFLDAYARAWTRFHETYPGAASRRMADTAWAWYLKRRPFDVLGRLQRARLWVGSQPDCALRLAQEALRYEPNYLDGLYFLYQVRCRDPDLQPDCPDLARRILTVLERHRLTRSFRSDYGRQVLAVPPARTPVHRRP